MKISRITSVLFLLAVVAAGGADNDLLCARPRVVRDAAWAEIRRPAAAMWQKEGARRTEQRRDA